MIAVVGEDAYWDDRDRIAESERSPIPDAGPASALFEGHVTTESDAAIAQAKVCLYPKGPCVMSDASGAFSLSVPPHDEIAISISAVGFGGRLVAITTTGADEHGWRFVLLPDAMLRARYAALGNAYPEPSLRVVFVTAAAPKGSPVGIEGVTIKISASSGRGPLFFAPNSDPDPQSQTTSTFSSGLFAGVQPGEVTLTFGPQSVTCLPVSGGWPSPLPNSVRVAVAAGYEARVTMRCHR